MPHDPMSQFVYMCLQEFPWQVCIVRVVIGKPLRQT